MLNAISRLCQFALGAVLAVSAHPALIAGPSGKTVGLVLDKGGKDDKSFNAAAFKGASEAASELGIKLKTVEATDDNAFEPALRGFAERNYDLIISIGFAQGSALNKVAAKYPKSRFVIVDSEVNLPNVKSILFEEHEGSFLVGALAALTGKSGKVGFVGGMDIPLIRRFAMGYEAGAKHINPKIKTMASYVGNTPDAWINPGKGKELALAQYEAGVTTIFTAAGASGMGVFDAAEEKKALAIGVDSNQNWIKPGRILTSMMKRVDVAVLSACRQMNQGKFSGGTERYGLANSGVDYAIDDNNKNLITPSNHAKIEEIKKDIISGKIIVPDYYKLRK
jgi:basic membrane protein A and related proteins